MEAGCPAPADDVVTEVAAVPVAPTETATVVLPDTDVAAAVVETPPTPAPDIVTAAPDTEVLGTVVEQPPTVAAQTIVGPPAPVSTVTQQVGPMPAPAPAPAPAGTLARTGAGTQLMALAAVGLLAIGRMFVLAGNRRARSFTPTA